MNDAQIGVLIGFALGLLVGMLTMYYAPFHPGGSEPKVRKIVTTEEKVSLEIPEGTRVQIDDKFYKVGIEFGITERIRCDCGGLIGVHGTVDSGLKCPVCGYGVVTSVACLSCGKHASCMEDFP